MVTLAQERFDFGLDLFDFIGAGDLDVDGADVGDAHEAFLGRRQGDDDDVVLVLAHGGLAFTFQDADDLIGLVVDADVLADGIGFVEEVGGDRRSDDGDAVARVEVALGDEGSRLDDEGPDVQVFRRDAVDRRIPVLVAVDDLVGTVDRRRYVIDVLYFILDGYGVVVFQFLARTGCRTDAAVIGRAWRNDEHIAAQAGDGVGDVLLDAHADGNHGNDGADADDDAQHGQDGAQFIGQQGRNGDLHAFTK